ncbi:MAG: hypothetical protein J1F32_03635 [Erysipelotrichales bacterium]|nr:hypothetical protein [Erysipelotrichales bacterium]
MAYVTVAYTKEMGDNPLTEEMKSVLSGLPLEKQIDYFVIEEETFHEESDYGEESHWTNRSTYPLKTQMQHSDFDVKVEKLIVHDGIIVGVYFYNKNYSVLLNKRVCTYSDSEDDGPWSSSISVVKMIVFVNEPKC